MGKLVDLLLVSVLRRCMPGPWWAETEIHDGLDDLVNGLVPAGVLAMESTLDQQLAAMEFPPSPPNLSWG